MPTSSFGDLQDDGKVGALCAVCLGAPEGDGTPLAMPITSALFSVRENTPNLLELPRMVEVVRDRQLRDGGSIEAVTSKPPAARRAASMTGNQEGLQRRRCKMTMQ
jgi:hypothetical protein